MFNLSTIQVVRVSAKKAAVLMARWTHNICTAFPT